MSGDPQNPGDDPTRRIEGPGPAGDSTERIDLERGFEAETPLREPSTSEAATGTAPDEEHGAAAVTGVSRGKAVALAVAALLVGFVLAFIVVALGTSDGTDDGQLVASQEEVEELERAVEERDAQIADLETRLAEAEAAAGARADDVEAQRQALDERAANLDDREAALQERAEALDERERQIEQREQDADDDSGTVIDEETAEGIIDRIVDQIRDLFE
jgi:hypothetical protein